MKTVLIVVMLTALIVNLGFMSYAAFQGKKNVLLCLAILESALSMLFLFFNA